MSARAVLAACAALVVLAACRASTPIVRAPGQHEQAFRGRVTRDVGARYLLYLPRGCDRASGELRFTVYPDATHDAWTRTYDDPALYEWLLRQRRRPVP